jgi:hypothetical protein
MATGLDGANGLARGQSVSNAGDPLEAPNQPLVQENFDDNKTGKLWKVHQDDPNCWVAEVNKQLEFASDKVAGDMFAGYLSDGWWIDPNHDFAMRLDLSYDVVTYEGGWLTFGVTPNLDEPRSQYISLGIGCVNRYPSYWHEWKDGYEMRWDFASRFADRVTLYISYEAFDDVLYVSDSGYGSENAWNSFPDFIQGRWGGPPLFVFVGGVSDGAAIDPGRAFVDDFAIESGRVVKPNDPGDPNDPNAPDDGPGEVPEFEVVVPVLVVPSTLKRQEATESLTVVTSLPSGLGTADLDDAEPLWLLPGGAEATERVAFRWLNGKTVVMASFSRVELLEAVPDNGQTAVYFVGRLKDGRYFGGAGMVTIE